MLFGWTTRSLAGCVRSGGVGQPEGAGRARRALRVAASWPAQGQRVGNRRVSRPLRLAMTAAPRCVVCVGSGW